MWSSSVASDLGGRRRSTRFRWYGRKQSRLTVLGFEISAFLGRWEFDDDRYDLA